MTPALARATWASIVTVTATGGVYAWMAYGMAASDPFDAVNHPWQPTMLQFHVLAAVPWLVVFGALLQAHVLPKLRRREPARRRSGFLLTVLAALMAGSGYLLQTSVDETWRATWCATHLATSAGFVVALPVHLLSGARARGARRSR